MQSKSIRWSTTVFTVLVFLDTLVVTAAFVKPRRILHNDVQTHKLWQIRWHKDRLISLLQAKNEPYDDSIYGSFEEGDVGISREGIQGTQSFFSLYYRIYNAQKEKESGTNAKLPLVVLHGGPSLPSQYLYPMVPHLKSDRPIIFFDQLGCGKSDEPRDKKFYSIEQSVGDLDTVLRTLGFNENSKVHLFGHSYGGNLAFEYAKKRPELVQSLLLSNTPTNMKVAGDAYDRLALRNPFGFWKQRVCSVESPALDNALQHVGSVWAGMDEVLDYRASPPTTTNKDGEVLFPRWTLVVTCSRDFAESSGGWKDVLSGSGIEIEQTCLEQCAHYPHVEDGESFGRILDEFMQRHDNA